MIELARQYGRYGYRRIAALLRDAGWQVNDKRVEHLWRREGLKVPGKQPKRGRLWLNDGSCVQRALPNAQTAAMLFWALMASGQIAMRRVDGWQTLDQAPVEQPLDLAA